MKKDWQKEKLMAEKHSAQELSNGLLNLDIKSEESKVIYNFSIWLLLVMIENVLKFSPVWGIWVTCPHQTYSPLPKTNIEEIFKSLSLSIMMIKWEVLLAHLISES